MHKFLRAIGFSNITKKDMEKIIDDIIQNPTSIKVTKDSEGNEFAELSKEYANLMGITVRGVYEEDDTFEVEYYYPYFIGTEVSTLEEIEIEKHSDKESYAGVCDEIRLGVALIFYLQNVCDYLAECNGKLDSRNIQGAILSGLSVDGKILLPAFQRDEKCKSGKNPKKERNQLIAQARDGDESAIESLTLEDMDTYTELSRRILQEDILSIVNTTFMPYGIESDHYSIIGEIMDCALQKNKETNEEIYCLNINCNDVLFDICINKKDLLGKPAIGRRFKGTIWMQGSVCL